jgi:hypothetical protein
MLKALRTHGVIEEVGSSLLHLMSPRNFFGFFNVKILKYYCIFQLRICQPNFSVTERESLQDPLARSLPSARWPSASKGVKRPHN